MASESSSAVLELTDADAEDTEAPSVSDDPVEGAPLIMEQGCDIAVKVDAPMKQLSTLETYVTYRVRCVCARWPSPPQGVRRRYNHFKALHKRLCASQPLIAPPPLPPLHSARQQLDRYSPAFVAVRTLALNLFLDRVAKHPIFTHSEDFRLFLTTPDEDLDKVFKSENSALNLWGLSSALYGGNSDAKPATNGARVKDPEFTSAADYLQSLQQKLTALCSLTTKLHKGTAALSDDVMGMKRACDAWSTQAGGRTARAAAATAAGAGGQAQALARVRCPLRHRAALPLLAAYAHAHTEKIKQRDAIHAAHVSGNNTDELHNRLEQASEALRSELSDWIPKTHAEIKALLLDIADKQVNTYTQTLMSWENALKLASEPNIDEIFKTVSKTAVQNLSPSKCKPELTPTETERDFEDIDYSNDDSDIDFDKKDSLIFIDGHLDSNMAVGDVDVIESLSKESKDSSKESKDSSKEFKDLEAVDIVETNEFDRFNINFNHGPRVDGLSKLDSNGSTMDSDASKVDLVESKVDSDVLKVKSKESIDFRESKLVLSNSDTDFDPLNVNSLKSDTNGIKEDEQSIGDGSEMDGSKKDGLKEDVILDPLQNFSEVDLTS